MQTRLTRSLIRPVCTAMLTAALVTLTTGCGYFKNVRDDLMDCGSIAVGGVPPLVKSGAERKVVGIVSPCAGVYVQATDFCHLGGLYKITGDVEWDRRGAGVMIDRRKKLGLGPFSRLFITQEPIRANDYKIPHASMEPWRRHMAAMRDPLFNRPAKELIFEPELTTFYTAKPEWQMTCEALPQLPFGWQDWEMLSVEVGIPEPFILHSGIYLRLGFDPSQVFDLLLTTFGYDLYDDAAYNRDGSLKYQD